jgi:hypothetical protein
VGELIVSAAQFKGKNRLLVFTFQEDPVFKSSGQAYRLVK